MLTMLEIARALAGLWRLVQLDPSGLTYFDRTLAGFWRSFRVAFLVAPVHAWLFVVQLDHIELGAGWARILIVAILTYTIGWFLFPAIAYEICRRIDRSAEYPGYIAVYNWSAIVAAALDLLASLPGIMGLMSFESMVLLSWLAYLLFIGYLWFLAKNALKLEGLLASGIVLLDVVLSWMLSLVSFGMMR
jgi:hypothetical protein